MSAAPLHEDGYHHPDLVDLFALRERNFRAPHRLYMPHGYEAPEVRKPRIHRARVHPWQDRLECNLWRVPTPAEREAERAIDARLDDLLRRAPEGRPKRPRRPPPTRAERRERQQERARQAWVRERIEQARALGDAERAATERARWVVEQSRLHRERFDGYAPGFVAADPARLWECAWCQQESTTRDWLSMGDGRCPRCQQ